MSQDTFDEPDAAEPHEKPRSGALRAIRKHCVECAGGATKTVLWCTVVDCNLWLYRFGHRPSSMPPELVTPKEFFGPDLDEESLPNGMNNAVEYLRNLRGEA